ncbi:class I SAM-dependent methyltransferase [Sinorhizobium meliloti]|uniref:class I SAM-dependent methyltransferase n=1 Tax=Rhizobium meliloti TaxID=382 RepID=UPI00067F6C67|nr:class I SAM-dependent methyltransferase [Sinorhizobium meliloti]MDE4615953.1 class I SAM-dependent methyltransferase [Sinorhizobium meliloti]
MMGSSSTEAATHTSYSGLAVMYDTYRPRYPTTLIDFLEFQATRRLGHHIRVMDVGAGTGIFTRQLARALSCASIIVGVEPNGDMRATATSASSNKAKVQFRDGSAEALPVEDKGIALLTAASAATWFNRSKFYAEALRVLEDNGLLALLMIRRNLAVSALFLEYERYHVQHIPGFRIGTFETFEGKYEDVDFSTELCGISDFSDVESLRVFWSEQLSWEQFIGLSLSRSDTKKIIQVNGLDHTIEWHKKLFNSHCMADQTVLAEWYGELCFATKRT